jgi:hypothetical protein
VAASTFIGMRAPRRRTVPAGLGVNLEWQLLLAVGRAYEAVGVTAPYNEMADLARVYAQWAEGADSGVVGRLERWSGN